MANPITAVPVSPGLRTMSFIPENHLSIYPQIPPSLYVYIQDKDSKEVFMMPSQSGHGHPLVANMVNKVKQREFDDFDWLGKAGEMLFGYGGVFLGRSYRTGYFHRLLRLTEDTPDAAILAEDCLPEALYFPVREWEQALCPPVRSRLFRSNGGFRTAKPEELQQHLLDLKLDDPEAYPDRVSILLFDILESIKLLTQYETLDLSRQKTLSTCKGSFFTNEKKPSEELIPAPRLVY